VRRALLALYAVDGSSNVEIAARLPLQGAGSAGGDFVIRSLSAVVSASEIRARADTRGGGRRSSRRRRSEAPSACQRRLSRAASGAVGNFPRRAPVHARE
jgi:hypothetical protein